MGSIPGCPTTGPDPQLPVVATPLERASIWGLLWEASQRLGLPVVSTWGPVWDPIWDPFLDPRNDPTFGVAKTTPFWSGVSRSGRIYFSRETLYFQGSGNGVSLEASGVPEGL